MKDIGVTIDSNLTFNEHINFKIDTANKILGLIRRSYRFLNCETFLPLYRSMMRSHFDYMQLVYGIHIKLNILKILKMYREEQQS